MSNTCACTHGLLASFFLFFFSSLYFGGGWWVGHTSHILRAGQERRRWQECVQRATPMQLCSTWALPVTSVLFISDGKCSGTHFAPHLHRNHTLQGAQLHTYTQVIHNVGCDCINTCRSYTVWAVTASIHAGHTQRGL